MQKNKQDWLFSPHRVNGVAAKEDAPSWYGTVQLGFPVDIAETAVDVAKDTGLSPYQVLHVYDRRDEAILRILRSGRNVSSPLVGYSINMTGSLPTSDADFDPSVNALEVSAYAKAPLRTCLGGIRPRNTVGHLSCSIGSIMDPVAREEGVLTTPDGLMAGRSMMIDPRNDDEHLHLLYRNGQLAAVPLLTANHTGTIDFSLAESFGSLEDGEYIMELSARNGASTDYAPAVARKAVIIRKAA